MESYIFCDLDGTLISSEPENVDNSILVERLNGRPLTYISRDVYALLKQVPEDYFVPVTSRTIAQYERIDLFREIYRPKYVLVDNGGILLIDGKEDQEWSNATRNMTEHEMTDYPAIMNDLQQYGKVKEQDGLVIFVKPYDEKFGEDIKKYVHSRKEVQLFIHHNKYYICSEKLTKGKAIERIKGRIDLVHAISAGDSEVDITMIPYVDMSFMPIELKKYIGNMEENKVTFLNCSDVAKVALRYKLEVDE